MMSRRKWGWALAALLALVVLVLYIARGRPRTLTIAIHQGIEGDALRQIAQRFSTKYKIEVQVLEFSYDELYDQEMAQLRMADVQKNNAGAADDDKNVVKTGPLFDVIMVDDPWLPALAGNVDAAGNSRLQKWDVGEIEVADFPESTLRVAKYCPGASCPSVYYAVPFVGNSQLFCYRTADFPRPEMAPTTWDAVVEFVRKKKTAAASKQPDNNATPLAYVGRIGPGNSIVTDFISMLWSRDGSLFPEQLTSQPLSLDGNGKAALDDLREIVGGQNGSTSVDDFDLAAYMVKGKASMGIVWSAWAMMLENLHPAGTPATLKFAPVPGGAPELGVWFLASPSYTKMTDEAKEFIQYATGREQLLRAALVGNPPPRRSVLRDAKAVAKKYPDLDRESVYAQLDQYKGSFAYQLDSLEHARARPRTPHWREVECILGKYLTKVVVENMDTKAAVNAVDSQLKNCSATSNTKCSDPPECP